MLLQDKYAVICGGGGTVGGAVVRAFVREGGRPFGGPEIFSEPSAKNTNINPAVRELPTDDA